MSQSQCVIDSCLAILNEQAGADGVGNVFQHLLTQFISNDDNSFVSRCYMIPVALWIAREDPGIHQMEQLDTATIRIIRSSFYSYPVKVTDSPLLREHFPIAMNAIQEILDRRTLNPHQI
jgi:hypothetical protein